MSSKSQHAHSLDHRTGRNIIAQNGLANPVYTTEPLTDFESICPDTELQSLNLNWRECDLPEKERTKDVHRLHPYLGKFIPQLVEIFLRKFQPRTVCDPFVGSGTTLVEACRLGIDSFGVDISPFNCLLTKVKTDFYDLELLEQEVYDILNKALPPDGMLFAGPRKASHNLQPTPYIAQWFAPLAQEELLSYCALIPEYQYADVLKIILSRSARSARLAPHYELDNPTEPQSEPYYCRKHRRICKPVEEAAKFLKRYSVDTIRRIKAFAHLRRGGHASVVCADSRFIAFPPSDLIVTSPPYLGLINYHEQHRYAYELLSLLPEPFASIGYTGHDGFRNHDEEIGCSSNGSGQAARKQYAKDIKAVFERATASMLPGAHVVVVINDKYNVYDDICASLGLEHIDSLNRHVNRRTGRRAGAFYEQVLI